MDFPSVVCRERSTTGDVNTPNSQAEDDLDAELRRLLVGTNEQRRRVGQTLYHFYRTLVFWREHGHGFYETAKLWSGAGASVFGSLATTLRSLGSPSKDDALRAYMTAWLLQLADDLERGETMFVSYIRWLEQRFPVLTTMMKEENQDSLIFDVELCERMANTLGRFAVAERPEATQVLRDAAADL